MRVIHEEICRHLPRGGEVRRLFHGRGCCFAGYEDLVLDAFGPVVMVTLYRERPQGWLEQLTQLLLRALPETPRAVLLQERFLPRAPSRLLHGGLPEVCEAREAGLVFRLRLGETQNVGFFPDMAVGRQLVRQRAEGRRVLNLFAYTCSFSVAALAGGAAQVVNLDMNRGALELGRLNHRLNGLDLRRASFLPLELFRSLGKLRRLGPFDLVICDPPASQGKSFTAERHWPKLVRSLAGLVRAGGEVLACNNAPTLGPNYLDTLLHKTYPASERIGLYRPGADFPEVHSECGLTLHHYRLPEVQSEFRKCED